LANEVLKTNVSKFNGIGLYVLFFPLAKYNYT